MSYFYPKDIPRPVTETYTKCHIVGCNNNARIYSGMNLELQGFYCDQCKYQCVNCGKFGLYRSAWHMQQQPQSKPICRHCNKKQPFVAPSNITSDEVDFEIVNAVDARGMPVKPRTPAKPMSPKKPFFSFLQRTPKARPIDPFVDPTTLPIKHKYCDKVVTVPSPFHPFKCDTCEQMITCPSELINYEN
jgi:hypothetical protein